MTRFRSPTTATLELTKALTLCKTLYSVVQNRPATSEALAKALGYKELNGTAGSVLATLKQYGLIVSTDEFRQRSKNAKFKLSDIAVKALNENPLSIQLASKLILTPSLYQKLYEAFRESLPDEDIKIIEEIMSQDFSEEKAKDLVRTVRSNWKLLHSTSEKVELPNIDNTDSTTLEYKLPPFKLLKDCEATVSFNSTITNEAIDKLIKHLELYKDVYPSIAEIRRYT